MNRTSTYEAPDLLRIIFDHSPTSIFAARAIREATTNAITDFQIYRCNPPFCAYVGQTENELTALTLHTLLGTTTQADFLEHCRRVVDTGEPFQGEHPYVGPNQSGWWRTAMIPFNDGLVVYLTDITEYKAAQQQALQATHMFETLVDSVPVSICLLRPQRDAEAKNLVTDLIVERVNRAAAQWRGLPIEQMEGRTYRDLFPQSAATNRVAQISEVLTSRQLQQYDFEYHADGLSGWFEQRNVPVGDQIIMITTDITERQQAELTLHESAQWLNDVVRVLPNGLVIAEAIRDSAGRIVDFRIKLNNPAAHQLAGLSADDIGRSVLVVDPAIQESGLFDRYVHLVETGEPLNMAYTFRNKELELVVSKHGDGFVATFTDSTARKRAEAALLHQANLLQTTLDASISSILAMTAIRDESGQIVDFRMDKANRAVERSLSRTPQELEGHTLLEVFPGNVENGFFALYAKAADTGEAQQATLHYTDVNGFEGWFEVSAVQQQSDDSAQDKIVLTFMNVTASKQLEQRLRESNASLDQFAAVASHDLQEPLRKIKSFGDVLIDQYGPALGDGITLLRRMQLAADRLQTLIRDLLAYSRLSIDGPTPPKPVNLNQLVADVLVDLEMIVHEKAAVIVVGALPTLTGDALQLRQVFQNLLTNALKFTKPGQPPHVSVTCRRIKRAELPPDVSLPARQYYQISVTDNGIGFRETYREKIFAAFERLHGKNSPYSGTGIGLAIVRKVMDNHHGAVTAHSTEGQGAVFTLYLPAQP